MGHLAFRQCLSQKCICIWPDLTWLQSLLAAYRLNLVLPCRLCDFRFEVAKTDVHVPVWAVRLDPHDLAGRLHPFQLLRQQHL